MDTGKKERLPFAALFVLILGTFMGILDASIVNVALPRLMAIFHASADRIQWVMTIYLLVGGMVIPASGYLGDRFGYKTLYLLAIGFFTVTSGLCGAAWSTNSLIIARALQALGGGMMIPLSMAMVYQIWPREKIGTALGLWGLTMTVAPAIGPTLGGYLTEYYTWRLVFYINLPIGFLTILLGLLWLKETPRQTGLRLDLPGLFLVGAACFMTLLALSKGQDWGWTSQAIVTLFLGAFFCFALFALWELQVPNPILDVRLLQNGVYTLSVLATSAAQMALFIGVFLIPIFCQNVQGYSPMQTGLILMPAALTAGFIMPLAGRLFDRVGAVPPGLIGLGVLTVTTYILRNLTADAPVHYLQFWLCMRSVGLGLCMMPLTTAGMNTVPDFLVGRASALMNVVRQIAASFSIALVSYVLVNRAAFHGYRLAEGVSYLAPFGPVAYARAEAGVAQVAGPAVARAATPSVIWGMIQKQAAVLAVGDAFLVATLMAAAAVPFALFLGKKRVAAARWREEERWGAAAVPAQAGLPPEVV